MARPRASDYDDKRRAILDRSAGLFAAHGYDRASMNRIAAACGVSKALLYHYYVDKEELLFDVIRGHLAELLEVTESADRPELPPQERLRALVGALLDAYRGSDAEHQVQINHLKLLSAERQAELKGLERALVRLFAEALVAVAPALGGSRLLKPVTMSLFGMLNWHYLWFNPNGELTRSDYAELATRLIVEGARAIDAGARRHANGRAGSHRAPAPQVRRRGAAP